MKGIITLAGTGMGQKASMLPEALAAIEDADILIGGERNLEPWADLGKEHFIVRNNLQEMIAFLKDNFQERKITVLVSGDPGFYSLLPYISRHFHRKNLKVIPGISSMQMAFAKVGISWHDAILLNLHGREKEVLLHHLEAAKIGMLTDPSNNPLALCHFLVEAGAKNFTVFICSNLGYNNEDILEFPLYQYREITIDTKLPAVMILADEA